MYHVKMKLFCCSRNHTHETWFQIRVAMAKKKTQLHYLQNLQYFIWQGGNKSLLEVE